MPTTASTTTAPKSTTVGGPICRQEEDNCYRCTDDGTACRKCMMRHYLYKGLCVAICPVGWRHEGSGWRGRTCVRDTSAGTTSVAPSTAAPTTSTAVSTTTQSLAVTCVAGENNCFQCKDTSRCEKCKNKHYLYQGQCVKSCPEGWSEVGSKWRGRRCQRITTTTPATTTSASVGIPVVMCKRGQNSCRRCASATACAKCKEYRYLHQGICVIRCPVGYIGEGSGYRGRYCKALVQDQGADDTCSAVQGCKMCLAGVCVQCGADTTLHQGTCVAACASTRKEYGGEGQANRGCIHKPDSLPATAPMPPSVIPECEADAKGCKRCRGGVCMQCKPWRVLLDGECVQACPTDTVEVGADGQANRVCL
jgi:hypothetical protein